jgi:hypothetical protein
MAMSRMPTPICRWATRTCPRIITGEKELEFGFGFKKEDEEVEDEVEEAES